MAANYWIHVSNFKRAMALGCDGRSGLSTRIWRNARTSADMCERRTHLNRLEDGRRTSGEKWARRDGGGCVHRVFSPLNRSDWDDPCLSALALR
eukprot:scaffold21167_cov33-Tisochrysis_lutea.AAC.5